MTDDRVSSDEMIRRAREDLARPAPPKPTATTGPAPKVQPGPARPPIRPRRIVSTSQESVVVPARRLVIAIAISGLLVIAGAVMAFLAAAGS